MLVIVAFLFGFMIYSASTEGVANMPQKILSYITTPVQKVTSFVSTEMSDKLDSFFNSSDIKKENEELQKQIDELTAQLIEFEQIKSENEQLLTIVEIKEQNTDYVFESASVIGKDPENKYETFTIDKGSLNGVELYDPVITSSGLVGWITEVGEVYSKVTTILSTNIEVGAYNIFNEQLGVVSGDIEIAEDGYTKMEYLEEAPNINDVIATSGSTGIFPNGIAIGTVVDVRESDNGASFYAIIEPSNDILKLTDVFVLTDFLGQGESTPTE